MSRRGLKARWKMLVYRDRGISEGCRVLLLRLSDDMTDGGRVSVPADRLANDLGITPRRVASRIKEAVDKGVLDRAGGAYPGRTATYDALVGEPRGRPLNAES